MSRIRKLTSAYADAAFVSGETSEFRIKSIRRPLEFKRRLPFRQQLLQQKLTAWQPSFHPIRFLTFVHVFGIILILLGFIMLNEINRVLDWEKDLGCKIHVMDTRGEFVDVCEINVTRDIPHPVMFSYKWDAVMQSHRLFPGNINKLLKSKDECLSKEPYIDIIGLRGLKRERPPCGAGINSNMEDIFELFDADNQIVPMTSEGIAHGIKDLLKHPFDTEDEGAIAKWKENMKKCDGIVNSSCWSKKFYELDEDIHNNGIENIDYFIWQNKAAFPSFRKPYRKLNNIFQYKDGLPKGVYKLKANMKSATNFDLKRAEEEKKDVYKEFVITVPSWLGMRNQFFAYLYIIVGSSSVFFGFILTYIHIKYGKTLEQKCSDSMPLIFHS